MHFLGLAGMPRRISDFPDAYAFWNGICTIGANVSFLSTLFFLVALERSLSIVDYKKLPDSHYRPSRK
jgi:heme/copper-type cytochrome/quinol oxidase subunit 1